MTALIAKRDDILQTKFGMDETEFEKVISTHAKMHHLKERCPTADGFTESTAININDFRAFMNGETETPKVNESLEDL